MAAKKKTKATKTTKKPGRAAPSKAPKKPVAPSAKKKAAPHKKAVRAAPPKKAAPAARAKKAAPAAPPKKAAPVASPKKPGGPVSSLKTFVQKVRDCEAGTGVWFITAGSVEHAAIQRRGGDGAIVIRTDAGATEAVSADSLFETADEARAARFL
jgi:hypothetical protein